MPQFKSFEKNNLDLPWHYIPYIIKGTAYKIIIMPFIVFYRFPAYYFKACCIDCITYLIAFQTKQILSSYPLYFTCNSSLNTETPIASLSFNGIFSALHMHRSCRQPITISYVLVISVHIAEILQRTNITLVHFTFPSIFSASNVRNYWNRIIDCPKIMFYVRYLDKKKLFLWIWLLYA